MSFGTLNWNFDVNNAVTSIPALFAWKALLVSCGWVVTRSGDGVANFGDGSDVISHAGDGANGLHNDDAWFAIQDPDGNREFCVQGRPDGVGESNWRFLFSRAAGFTGGGAAVRATATDEHSVYNDTAVASYINYFPGHGANSIYHMGASASSVNGEWPWYFIQVDDTTGVSEGQVIFFAVDDAHEDHVDPYALYSRATAINSTYFYNGTYLWTWYHADGVGANWERCCVDANYREVGDMMGDDRTDPYDTAYHSQVRSIYHGFAGAAPTHRWRMGMISPFLWTPDNTLDLDDLYEDQDGNVWKEFTEGIILPWPDNATAPLPAVGAGGFTVHDLIVSGEAGAGLQTYYRNRVWDSSVSLFVRWATAVPDSGGASYPGPGAWGVDTSDFCVDRIYIA